MSLSKVNLTKLARAQRRHSREQRARKKVFAGLLFYEAPILSIISLPEITRLKKLKILQTVLAAGSKPAEA